MIARLVMDLPEPDSPTIPTAPPRGTSRSRDFTTSVRPSAVGKLTVRSRTSRRFPSSEFGAVLRAVSGTDPHPRVDHRSEEHTSELQSRGHLVCRLLLEKKKLHISGKYTQNGEINE